MGPDRGAQGQAGQSGLPLLTLLPPCVSRALAETLCSPMSPVASLHPTELLNKVMGIVSQEDTDLKHEPQSVYVAL